MVQPLQVNISQPRTAAHRQRVRQVINVHPQMCTMGIQADAQHVVAQHIKTPLGNLLVHHVLRQHNINHLLLDIGIGHPMASKTILVAVVQI